MKSKILNVLSLLLVLTAGVAAYADKIKALEIVPEKFAWLWPFILIGSAALNRITLIVGDVIDDWQLNNSFKLFLLVLIPTSILALCLSGCATDERGRTTFDAPTAWRVLDAVTDVLRPTVVPVPEAL